MNNPMNMIKNYITQGLTPQNILGKMNIDNPILNNVISMAKNGDTSSVENFARNICKQKGVDFDSEFTKFRNNFK